MNREYIITQGDDFYRLAQRFGGSCEDIAMANPNLNPEMLQVGQKIVLPELKVGIKGQSQFAEVGVKHGEEFSGEHFDEVEMEVEGIVFRVRRVGEGKIPHEIHLLIPRTEIHKIQPAGVNAPCEVQIMLSNVEIVHSPRLMSGGEHAERAESVQASQSTAKKSPGAMLPSHQ